MIAGLDRGRCRLASLYGLRPFAAVPLTAAAAIGAAVIESDCSRISAAYHAPVQAAVGLGFSAALGFAGGRVLARDDCER